MVRDYVQRCKYGMICDVAPGAAPVVFVLLIPIVFVSSNTENKQLILFSVPPPKKKQVIKYWFASDCVPGSGNILLILTTRYQNSHVPVVYLLQVSIAVVVFFIPFIIFALQFSLPPSRNSDPGSHRRLFSPPTHYGSCLAFLSRENFSSFFPRWLASNCAYHARRSQRLILFIYSSIYFCK